MYTFAQRLKITAFVLMGLGFIGLAIGFASAPSTVAEAQAMIADAHGGHGDAHGSEHNTHDSHAADTHNDEKHHDVHAGTDAHVEHHEDKHVDVTHAENAHADDHHGEHLLHQLQNKPWAALYVAAFFFFMIALGTLMFYAIQRAAQAGWPILLFRVMEGITAYLVPGSIIIYVFLVLTGLHANHLFVWMDAETVAHDEIIQGKVGYLNVPFFLIRVDNAGNISKRFSAGGFHFARFGGTCPRWHVHDAFRIPGKISTQTVQMEDGTRYFSIARTVSRDNSGFGVPDNQFAIAMGCEIKHADKLVYARGMNLENDEGDTPIGVNCRLCERRDCNQRATPSVNRALRLDEHVRGLSPFDF